MYNSFLNFFSFVKALKGYGRAAILPVFGKSSAAHPFAHQVAEVAAARPRGWHSAGGTAGSTRGPS